MANIKSLNSIRDKWEDNASSSQASSAYRDGVRNPRRSWEDSTAAANEARLEGLRQAEERNAFVEGVREAGNAKWQQRAENLGPSRFSQGVKAAGSDFESGFRPYHNVISGLSLPPRGPKGDPANIERVRVVAEALHQERISG